MFEITVGKDFTCPSHNHPCTEIVICWDCSGEIYHAGRPLKYSAGTFFTYQPAGKHWIRNVVPGSQLCIGLSGCGSAGIPFGIFKMTNEIESIASRMISESKSRNLLKGEYIDTLAGQLSIEILRISQKTEKDCGLARHADAAKKILDSRFDEPISIRELASSLFISPDYLRELFRETFGESPMHYLIRRRIEFACQQLDTGNSSIAEIADKCGIGNPYYFSRLFRKITGLSPSEYREKQRR